MRSEVSAAFPLLAFPVGCRPAPAGAEAEPAAAESTAGSIEALSDERLEHDLRRIFDTPRGAADYDRQRDSRMLEMARRGGPRWTAYLQRMWDEQRAREFEQLYTNGYVDELVLLTALRRAQRRPDPARLELLTGAETVWTAGHAPVLEFAIRNVDPDESFEFVERDCRRLRAEITSSSGEAWTRKPSTRASDEGPAELRQLAPGESTADFKYGFRLSIDVSESFDPQSDGACTLLVAYAPQCTVFDRSFAFVRDVHERIFISSDPIALVVDR